MGHHKRRRPKSTRAGCLMCKPHKANGAKGGENAKTIQDKLSDMNMRDQINEMNKSKLKLYMCGHFVQIFKGKPLHPILLGSNGKYYHTKLYDLNEIVGPFNTPGEARDALQYHLFGFDEWPAGKPLPPATVRVSYINGKRIEKKLCK